MKDFTLESMLAILQEMLGWILWLGLVLAAVAVGLFIRSLLRQRGFKGPAARNALLLGVLGGAAAALVAPFFTQAGFGNIHGPVDWALLALIGIGAFGVSTVAAFGVLGTVCKTTARL